MKKLIIGAVLISIVIGTVSCKKWLDLKPQDGIVREEFWQTKEQVDAAVTGIYASLLSGTSGNYIAPAELFFYGVRQERIWLVPVSERVRMNWI